eukprot:TRINITY_DN90786_c0_g1_i1.p1 TRINITY_DN90786_c0_g1~~TRINITY_DN90786_c0_g1_i1.p1  ORF type:complete len:345 (-),score=41.38 TRINITY_DN90786_c0_g1_i1:225-1259(-)
MPPSREAPHSNDYALVKSVARALEFAINDPSAHLAWNDNVCRNTFTDCGGKWRLRDVAETKQAATIFDSSVIPPIGIEKYLLRLATTFRCSDSSFVAALIVVDRLLVYDGGRLPLTMRNVHRVFLASLLVSVKYHEDLVYSNNHYAKGGGVHLKEVNRLERMILATLDFDLRVQPEQFELYQGMLHEFGAVSLKQCEAAGFASARVSAVPGEKISTGQPQNRPPPVATVFPVIPTAVKPGAANLKRGFAKGSHGGGQFVVAAARANATAITAASQPPVQAGGYAAAAVSLAAAQRAPPMHIRVDSSVAVVPCETYASAAAEGCDVPWIVADSAVSLGGRSARLC